MASLGRRLNAWLEQFASRPYATGLLFVVALIEGSIAPLPPDIPFLALSVARPKRSFLFGSICVAGSVAGAVIGYYVGSLLYESVGQALISFYNVEAQVASLLAHYRENAWLTLILAGCTTIPFCIFTIAAGFHQTLDIGTFFLACLAGRAIRFYLLSGILFVFGGTARHALERSLIIVPIVLLVLFVLGFVLGRNFL
ncbi:DedA family protein [bacterium]|nr:MAG: DedA family protein [bacterium]